MISNGLFYNNYGKHDVRMRSEVTDLVWDWLELPPYFCPLLFVVNVQGRFHVITQVGDIYTYMGDLSICLKEACLSVCLFSSLCCVVICAIGHWIGFPYKAIAGPALSSIAFAVPIHIAITLTMSLFLWHILSCGHAVP